MAKQLETGFWGRAFGDVEGNAKFSWVFLDLANSTSMIPSPGGSIKLLELNTTMLYSEIGESAHKSHVFRYLLTDQAHSYGGAAQGPACAYSRAHHELHIFSFATRDSRNHLRVPA